MIRFRMRASQQRQHGIALIMVLLVMTVIGAISLAIMSESRAQLELSSNVVSHAQAEMVADAAAHAVVASLLVPEIAPAVGQDLSRLLDEFALPGARPDGTSKRAAAEDNPALLGWRTDGTPYTVVTEQGRLELRIIDERGKIDINRAPDELLRGLLVAAGLEPAQAFALTDAIIDFRDTDSNRRAQGAEDPEYASARLPWEAKDAAFESSGDLMQVLGMTPEIYARISPAVTVYSRQAAVNPTNASRQVLLALPGVDEAE